MFRYWLPSLVCDLSLRIICLGNCACDLSFGHFRLRSFALKHSLGNFSFCFRFKFQVQISGLQFRFIFPILDLWIGSQVYNSGLDFRSSFQVLGSRFRFQVWLSAPDVRFYISGLEFRFTFQVLCFRFSFQVSNKKQYTSVTRIRFLDIGWHL